MEVSPEGGTFFELRKEGRIRKRCKEMSESEWIQRHGDCGRCVTLSNILMPAATCKLHTATLLKAVM